MKLTNYTTNNKRLVRKLYGIVGAIATLAIPYIIMHFDTHIESSQSFCPHKMLTGLPCPGCGITKSLIFFYQGDIYKSISYHVLGPIVVVFCLITIITLTTEIITRRDYFTSILFSKKLAYILAIALATYHLVRVVYFIANHSFDYILKESIWM